VYRADGGHLADLSNSRTSRRRVAVLMTCHNRVSSTVRSIAALKAQVPAGIVVDLFLVDDGSSDGTSAQVDSVFPGATILTGDGNLYWNGGMRLAFGAAMQEGYDFYFWLNDDTNLETDALARLAGAYDSASAQTNFPVIVVGSTRDPVTGELSYGGWHRLHRRVGLPSWQKKPPDPENPVSCDTMNGNCVLIPRSVAERVGNLDPVFRQGFGDLDYGLRAVQLGCRIVVAPGYYGSCENNDGSGMWTDGAVPVLDRWRKLLGPKGLPIRAWATFTRRHKGPLWFLSWLAPYVLFWPKALFLRR
jgi:GT2 family glycosyltransferase